MLRVQPEPRLSIEVPVLLTCNPCASPVRAMMPKRPASASQHAQMLCRPVAAEEAPDATAATPGPAMGNASASAWPDHALQSLSFDGVVQKKPQALNGSDDHLDYWDKCAIQDRRLRPALTAPACFRAPQTSTSAELTKASAPAG
jgi:hypothetical protein